MTDPIAHMIDRLEAADAAEVPSLFKTLIRRKELSRVMVQINADLLGGDHAQRSRASGVLAKLGFPQEA